MKYESFVWVGPVSADASAGRVARTFVAGLTHAGADVEVLDTGDGAIATGLELDGAVHGAQATVVRQAPLSELARTTALLPLARGARQVAYTIADRTELTPRDAELLAACDEVWAPSFTQCELLAALGVERRKLCVVAPGGPHPRAERARSAEPRRCLVIGAQAPAGAPYTASRAVAGSRAAGLELDEASAIVLAADTDPWGITALDAFASGKPVVCAASGAALELADPLDGLWLEGTEAWREPHVQAALERDWDALVARAERVRARLTTLASERAAALALLERGTVARALPEERLTRVLASLGWSTPAERLIGSRPRVEIVPVDALAGAWTGTLLERLRRAGRDVTVVAWVDEALHAELPRITAEIEGALARSGRSSDELDVLVVTAPLAHAPRERLVAPARVSAA
jgi:hypothetical protein